MERGPAISPSRLVGVDGLRALAASSILIYHCWLYSSPNGRRVDLGPLSELLFPYLRLGVTLFFTLSGFLLYRPLVSSLLRRTQRPSLRSYLRNRTLRILPAYWCVLLGVALLFRTTLIRRSPSVVEVGSLVDRPILLLRNLTLTQNYSPDSLLTGIGPAWSLAVEVVYYLTLPMLGLVAVALAATASKRSGRTIAALVPALLLLAIGLLGKWAARLLSPSVGASPGWDGDWHSVLIRSFLGQADLFAFGMALAVVYVNLEDGALRFPVWWRRAAVATFLGIVTPTMLLSDPDRVGDSARETLMALACALLVGLVVLPDSRAGPPPILTRLLETRAVVAIGVASYSLFLWHEPLVRWLQLHGWTMAGASGFVVNLLLLAVVSGLLAALTYRYVERPALRHKASARREAAAAERAPSEATSDR
jgi:peptidoglycan/LPS O-acetylase OafA/YrhL